MEGTHSVAANRLQPLITGGRTQELGARRAESAEARTFPLENGGRGDGRRGAEGRARGRRTRPIELVQLGCVGRSLLHLYTLFADYGLRSCASVSYVFVRLATSSQATKVNQLYQLTVRAEHAFARVASYIDERSNCWQTVLFTMIVLLLVLMAMAAQEGFFNAIAQVQLQLACVDHVLQNKI